MLLGEHACEREGREVAVGDENLAEEAPAGRLLAEGLLELVLGQQLFGDQDLAELPPGKLKCRALHVPLIGREGSIVQSFSTSHHNQGSPQDLQVVPHKAPARKRAAALEVQGVEVLVGNPLARYSRVWGDE